MIDYKTLIKLVEKYDEEASRVFNKLQKAADRRLFLFYLYTIFLYAF